MINNYDPTENLIKYPAMAIAATSALAGAVESGISLAQEEYLAAGAWILGGLAVMGACIKLADRLLDRIY